MAPTKGKQGTKGAKQIKEENKATYNHYIYIIIAANLITVLIQFLRFNSSLRFMHWIMLVVSSLIYLAAVASMNYMVKGGLDLNMESGIGEHLKDIILVTTACQILGCVSLYFWLLWLVIPTVAFYKLWVNILSPWVFAEPPPEMSDKKKKKMERKQQKVIYR